MQAAGDSRARQFWAAVANSAPQPVGAVIAFLLVDEVGALLPLSFAFAAGAMLALVAVEVAPQAIRGSPLGGLSGVAIGALAMLALSAAIGSDRLDARAVADRLAEEPSSHLAVDGRTAG